jgi:tetratricopeptide (TPR) repeat protein
MLKESPSNLPSHASEAPAVLVWLPGMAHNQAPVHAQQGWRQGLERLRHMLGEMLPRPTQQAAKEGVQVGGLGALIDACRRFQQGSANGDQPSFSGHLGVAMLHSQEGVAPQEVQRAQCIARFAPVGTIGLEAEAVDAFERSWELPLVDLGEVQCTECGDLKPTTKVLALTADQRTRLPDPLALRDVLAVLTPRLTGDHPLQAEAAGHLLADTIRTSLTRSALVRVIASESARRLGPPRLALQDAFELLHATHVLRCEGTVATNGQMQVQMELLAPGESRAMWSSHFSLSLEDLLAGQADSLMEAIASVHAAMVSQPLQLAQLPAWVKLEDHQLLISASQLIHRLSPAAFDRSRDLLEALVRRRPDQAVAHAWQAKWHVMAAVQGIEPVPAAAASAVAAANIALQLDTSCALAHSLGAMARLMLRAPLSETGPAFVHAVNCNPSEALAWMYEAAHALYEDRSDAAEQAIRTALALSPLDPWQYMFDATAAHVYLANERWDLALQYAQSAARLRARHAPTLLFHVIAQARLGRLDLANEYLRQLLELWPRFSLTLFWETYAGRDSKHAHQFAWALTAAGLPS